MRMILPKRSKDDAPTLTGFTLGAKLTQGGSTPCKQLIAPLQLRTGLSIGAT